MRDENVYREETVQERLEREADQIMQEKYWNAKECADETFHEYFLGILECVRSPGFIDKLWDQIEREQPKRQREWLEQRRKSREEFARLKADMDRRVYGPKNDD